MNPASLQHALDRVVAASRQQWLLRAGAASAAVAAMGIAVVIAGWSATAFVVVLGLAVLTSLWPDSHAPLVVDVVVILSLAVAIDDPASPWLPCAAVCLLAHHAAVGLAASIPIGGELPASVIVRRARHAALVAGATVALWLVVVVLEQRELPGNVVVSVVGLAAATGLALALREQSVEPPR